MTDVLMRGARDERPARAGAWSAGITVRLTGTAINALARVSALTGDSRTDSINRALQVYEMIEQHITAGGEVYLKDVKGAVTRIRIF